MSVAVLASIKDKLVLVGGELEPSARGHAGAGNFSDQATIIGFEGSGGDATVTVGGSCRGPVARGWSAGAVWRDDRVVVVGGLCGDDTQPVRLMDVWEGRIEQQ